MHITQANVAPSPAVGAFAWSSVGKKILMALTGFVFVGFVIGHMIGNLQLFMGQDQLNKYAEALQHLGGLLWVVRLFLLAFFVIHIWTGIRLYFQNQAARPVSYRREDTVQATLSSRTMIWTGLGMLLYVIYHLMHFTLLTTNPEWVNLTDSLGRHDVYTMVVLGFRNYWVSGVYILAMLLLAFHLNHAVPSLLQTLGLTRPCYRQALKRAGNVIALVVFLGYLSMPLGVLLGCVTLPGGGH